VYAHQSSTTQAARQALAGRLRELRVDAGLTAIELAAKLTWHRTKVSRVEHVNRSPSIADVRAWCRACGADAEADDLVAALHTIEDSYVQWRRLERTGLRRLQESHVPLLDRTRLMREYCSQVVPGLLQPPGTRPRSSHRSSSTRAFLTTLPTRCLPAWRGHACCARASTASGS
jgi:transcriptional regulator with XRE-family HTH domain